MLTLGEVRRRLAEAIPLGVREYYFTGGEPFGNPEMLPILEETLRQAGVRSVVIAGLATDYCVKATALDSAGKGFATTVLREGIRAVEFRHLAIG